MHDILIQNGVLQVWPAATVLLAGFMIGFSTGGWPGGAGLAAPILTLATPFERAQAAVLPMLVFSQFLALLIYRDNLRLREVASVIVPATAGVGIGWYIWSVCLDLPAFPVIRQVLKLATALLTTGLALNLYLTRVREPPIPPPAPGPYAGAALCITAGVLSTIANVAGPLVVWFLNTRHLRKETLTATVAVSFLVINIIKFVPYSALGFYDTNSLSRLIDETLTTLPVFICIVTAVFVGRWCMRTSTQRQFDMALVVGMLVVAAAITWQIGPDIWRLLVPRLF